MNNRPAAAGTIERFIVNGSDYFSAYLDNGKVCIGLIGGVRFDFPADHGAYHSILTYRTEREVEIAHDECASRYL